MAEIRRLDSRAADFGAALAQLLDREMAQDRELVAAVAAIIDAVRRDGDAALLRYSSRFDRLELADAAAFELPLGDCEAAWQSLDPALREALDFSARRIEAYARRQSLGSFEFHDDMGVRLGQRITPMDRVGIYVPGGKAAYPSSVLMNAIPARVAGVREIIMTVPAPGGELNPAVLAAAHRAGVQRVFRLGGAQAVAALAYGTATVPAVDKIVGPGNAWVAEAKRQVFGRVGIDSVAGPSEIAVICDGGTDPDWIAMDLFSQAEHDEMAQAILLTPDAGFADAVVASMQRRLRELPRAPIVEASIRDRGAIILTPDLDAAAEICNHIAPEHLELSVADPDALLPRIRHAGAIFLGRHTPEALGDYCAGPNHVLPTARGRPRPRGRARPRRSRRSGRAPPARRRGAPRPRARRATPARWACTSFRSAAA